MLLSPLIAGVLAALGAVRADAPREERFPPAELCARCHSNTARATAMRDATGAPIAPFDLWRSSPMANAFVDPLWRAAVSAEVASFPTRAGEIRAKCASCHAPASASGAVRWSDRLASLGDLGAPASDGVACAVCHRIAPEGLGTPESFSGHFALDDQARAFGPHARPFAMPMRHHTGLTPTEGEHVTSSALCGTCHTLHTAALDEDGRATGERLPEQTPYLEWRNSDFVSEGSARGPLAATCQDCHVPTRDVSGTPIRTRIARNPAGRDWPPIAPREPFGRHTFVGANTLLPALLRDGGEAGARASDAAYDATIVAARRLLGQAARLELRTLPSTEGELALEVRVLNLAGHKLPSAHPTRRAWLRVEVFGADGAALFCSGATDAQGRLVGADGAPLPSELAGGPVAPHRSVVRTADEVVLYEAVMADADDEPTYRLMAGGHWWKDDRLLPRGWLATHPDAADTAPVGTADDADFRAGEDTVLFHIPLAGGAQPAHVRASLLHQALSARYAAELFTADTPETRALERLWRAADHEPEVLAGGQLCLDGR